MKNLVTIEELMQHDTRVKVQINQSCFFTDIRRVIIVKFGLIDYRIKNEDGNPLTAERFKSFRRALVYLSEMD